MSRALSLSSCLGIDFPALSSLFAVRGSTVETKKADLDKQGKEQENPFSGERKKKSLAHEVEDCFYVQKYK